MNRHRQTFSLALVLVCSSIAPAFGNEPLRDIDRNPSFLVTQVMAAIHSLGVGINTGNFQAIRTGYVASSVLAKQSTEQQFAQSFKPFIDNKIDLTRLDAVQPTLDGTGQVGPHNELVVSGHYSTEPRLDFKVTFIREGSHLGVSGIDLDTPQTTAPGEQRGSGPALTKTGAPPTTPMGAADVPDAKTMSTLMTGRAADNGVALPADQQAAVAAALHAFAIGVQNKDMDRFLSQAIVSPLWRKATTAEQLAASYRDTIDHGADFAKFQNGRIIVSAEPTTSALGELKISGICVAADGEQLGFRVGFDREAGQLKLINLVVARTRDPKKP